MDFTLEPRVPKGGGSSGGRGSSGKSSKSKSSKSKGGHVAAGGGGGGGGGGFSALPLWARILIIVLIVWFILFLIAFTYYLVQELKRKKDGKEFRMGHVLGHALVVSTGLWVPVFLYKKLAARRGAKSGTYAKIEEGHAKESGHDSWYGGAGGANDAKYDPVAYPPAYRPHTPDPASAPAPAPAPAQPGQTGAAAEYYMPAPPSHTAPAQHPPQYA